MAALLGVVGLLWLSERLGWIAWRKGYPVLIAVAITAAAALLFLVWMAVCRMFRRRPQFSLRSLLVWVLAVAVVCSWLAAEWNRARRQDSAMERFHKLGGQTYFSWRNASHTEPKWLRDLLSEHFFDRCTSTTIWLKTRI